MDFRDMLIALNNMVCTWFGIGYLRPAPGTWGSLATLPIPILIVYLYGLNPLAYILLVAATIGLLILGTCCCSIYNKVHNKHDAPEIVIDEVVGVLTAVIATANITVPITMQSTVWGLGLLLIIFFVFRFYDIFKPFPIRWLDKHVHGGIGVMLDDVVAGIFTAITIQCVFWVLVQWSA